MACIYVIQNIKNKKCYVGQTTKSLRQRYGHHRCDLNNNIHHNKYLQDDWNKYGESCFICKLLEVVDTNNLDERERYWIEFFHSDIAGYNIANGGRASFSFSHTDDEIIKMRRIQEPDVILQFDLDFNFVKEWIGGSSHICKEFGGTKECYLLRCSHRIKEMSPYKGYYWVYKEEFSSPLFSWNKYLLNEKIIEIKTKESKSKQKPVYQYDLELNLIKIWNCLADIRKVYGNTSSISAVLNKNRGKRTAYGFIWAYEDCDFSDGYFDLSNRVNAACEKRKKAIHMIDSVTKNIIKTYESLTDACNDIGANASNIAIAAKGYPNHKCKSYLWKYAE